MPACGLLLRCRSPSSSSARRQRRKYVFVLTIYDRQGTKLLLGRFCARRLAAIPHCGRASGENAATVALLVAAPFDNLVAGCPHCALGVERETGEVRTRRCLPPRQHILPAFQLSITAPYAESLSIRSTPLSGKF